jgi:cytochrome c2
MICKIKTFLKTITVISVLPIVVTAQSNGNDNDWTGTPQNTFLTSEIVQTYQCTSCHTIAETGGTVGPVLNQIGNRRDADWLRRWLADPQQVRPGTKMPNFDFPPNQLNQVLSYLTKMKKPLRTDDILASSAPAVDKGKSLFLDYDCTACHRMGSEGRFVGPDLTWIGKRKTQDWEKIWLTDPPAFKADTFMPNFHIPEKGVEALAAYLHTLQGQDNAQSQEWELRTNFFLGNNAKERGELIFRRFACWACHGESGAGGITNPNMAPDELMPALRATANKYTEMELLTRLKQRTEPPALAADKPAPPFFCPDYGNHMDESEFSDLYAYLKSFAPKRSKWRIK